MHSLKSIFLGLALSLPLASAVQAHGNERASNIQPVFNQAITNIPGKSMVAVTVDYPAGGGSPAHTHAASAFIFAYVVQGAIRSQVDGGPVRVYHAGESFYETPGQRHGVSENASKTKPAKLLAVFVVDSDAKDLTTPD
ncbi:cupin domain-containing protein [Rhodoferax sp.]|uniref:cupin domain-containing protein n=1 Tax=Rhodoferax sp. TaxID=50421 RepID=UPI00374D91C7